MYTYIHIHTDKRLQLYIFKSINVHAHIETHTRLHTCIHTHAYTHTHMHTHTRAHTHAHSYTQTKEPAMPSIQFVSNYLSSYFNDPIIPTELSGAVVDSRLSSSRCYIILHHHRICFYIYILYIYIYNLYIYIFYLYIFTRIDWILFILKKYI